VQPNCIDANTFASSEKNRIAKIKVGGGAMFARRSKERKKMKEQCLQGERQCKESGGTK